MDKKSKDALRRYKKSRHNTHSSTESSSSDTDTGSSSSYSSSDSEHHNRERDRHRKKKSSRRANSSSGDERQQRKRDKRDHCQKKLEAKRNHLKRKLKEAKLKKRAAAAAAALSGHGHRSLSPATQAKLKKLAERKHLRAASKERREREREKIRVVQRERDRDRDHHRMGGNSRSPPPSLSASSGTTTKIRIHQDIGKRQKSPGMSVGTSSSSSSRMHHQLMSREKIIIQTRTRDRTPSMERDRERMERQRHEIKMARHDELSMRDRERRERERERAEREAAREKERAEALARCQERQRERERLAREKMRREQEDDKKYGNMGGGSGSGGGSERMRQLSERELDMGGPPYGSRERSLEPVERTRHINKREIDPYEREQEYLDSERHGMLEDMRRYAGSGGSAGGSVSGGHRRRDLSPMVEHYGQRMRDPRDLYVEEERERERVYKRNYMDVRYSSRERETWLESREMREHELHDPRDFRDAEEVLYDDAERECVMRERERTTTLSSRGDWKNDWDRNEWDEPGIVGGSSGGATPGRAGGFIGGPKRGLSKQQSIGGQQGPSRAGSEHNWDADEPEPSIMPVMKPEPVWIEHEQRDKQRAWAGADWRATDDGFVSRSSESMHMSHQQQSPNPHHMHVRSERGGRGFRRGGGSHGEHLSERNSQGYRPHPPPLMTLPVQPPGGYHGASTSMSSRVFSHKRLTYTNPGYGKKHPHALGLSVGVAHTQQPQQHQQHQHQHQQHSPQAVGGGGGGTPIKSSAAQASAVAAATTAVAAAKAAAQSSANATTNPGILAQVSKLTQMAGSYLCDDGETAKLISLDCDDKRSGELSEISDSEDDILNKTEKVKPRTDELTECNSMESGVDAVSSEDNKTESTMGAVLDLTGGEDINGNGHGNGFKPEDDEVLDFEEISDGELEEESRHKSVNDAIGVDWQGLIAETRKHATEYALVQDTDPSAGTGKQRWQPHRILLDVGVSLRMAGTYFGQQLLNEARTRMHAEREEEFIKRQQQFLEMQQPQMLYNMKDGKPDHELVNGEIVAPAPPPIPIPVLTSLHTLALLDDYQFGNSVAEPLACVQVAVRRQAIDHQAIVAKVCCPNNRALSARQDLKLRRQLSGIPVSESSMPSKVLKVKRKLRSRTMHWFHRRALEVK